MYGEPSELIGRHALHSTVLSFPDGEGQDILVRDSVPDDMAKVIKEIFGKDTDISLLVEKCKELLLS